MVFFIILKFGRIKTSLSYIIYCSQIYIFRRKLWNAYLTSFFPSSLGPTLVFLWFSAKEKENPVREWTQQRATQSVTEAAASLPYHALRTLPILSLKFVFWIRKRRSYPSYSTSHKINSCNRDPQYCLKLMVKRYLLVKNCW